MRDHVVLCGSDGLAVRVLEELRALGTDVIVVAADPGHRLEQRARDLDTPLIEGDFRDEDALREADAADAEAVAVLEDDDVGNLHAALAVQEINPDVRLVVRMFNLELGHRLEALFHDGEVLSASVLAAPALAHAALEGNVTRPVRVRDRLLEVRAATDGGGRRLGVDVRESEEAPEPVTDAMSRQAASLARRWRARLRGVLRLFDARLAALLGTLAVLLAISAEVFHNAGDLSWMNSLYFTVTTITTTGYGDINLLNADDGVKLYGMALMLLGGLTVAVLFALVTDAIVTARIARTLGELPRPRSGHAVVCGLGNVGFRTVQRLVAAGVPCVAVERREDSPFLDATRRLGVPVLVDDASRLETLAPLRLPTARAVLAVTDDDLANLEVALNARAAQPADARRRAAVLAGPGRARPARVQHRDLAQRLGAGGAGVPRRDRPAAGRGDGGPRRPCTRGGRGAGAGGLGARRAHGRGGRGRAGAARARPRRRLVAAGRPADRPGRPPAHPRVG